jgi:hypothetical protein
MTRNNKEFHWLASIFGRHAKMQELSPASAAAAQIGVDQQP